MTTQTTDRGQEGRTAAIHARATDLIGDLAEVIGDDAGIYRVLNNYLDAAATGEEFGFVAVAALRQMFAECLIRHEGELPPDAVTYGVPEEATR